MSKPRNVLFIIADQFRADCLGYTGNPIIKTPNLDSLAASGATFTRAFVQSAPCGPSRSCIFTSRYLCSTRVVNNMTPMIDAEDNLAMYLRVAGHRPCISGYNDYAYDPRILPDDHPYKTSLNYNNFMPGFEVRLDHEYDSPQYYEYLRRRGYPESFLNRENLYAHNVPPGGQGRHSLCHFPARYTAEDSECQFQTSDAVEFIRERRGQGWVLSLNYLRPHPPMICPPPYHEMYDPAAMPRANRRPEELHYNHLYWQIMHRNPRLQDDLHLREYRACYYGMISELDACIGRLLDALHETEEWDNTLIIFTSDHGEYLGDHWLTDKGHFYDETMRVPYIIRDPRRGANATRGKTLDVFVESIDSAPTILEYLDVAVPDRVMGRSLLGLLHGRTSGHRDEIHYEFDFRNRVDPAEVSDPDQCLLWVLRDENYKYVQFAAESMPPLLYDLRVDSPEQHDIATQPGAAPFVAAYAQRMLRWRMKCEDQRMEHWAAPYRQ